MIHEQHEQDCYIVLFAILFWTLILIEQKLDALEQLDIHTEKF